MAEKELVIEKALNKNYLKVQKSEVEVVSKSEKLLEDFSKSSAKNEKELNVKQKEVTKEIKETKEKFKTNLNTIKAEHKKHLETIKESVAVSKELNAKEIEKSNENKVKKDEALNNAIEKIENEYQKNVDSALKEYESEIQKSEKVTEEINDKAHSDIEKQNNKLEDAKAKHEAKVAAINDKRLKKVDKLTEDNNKKIDKVNADILKEESRIEKQIIEMSPVFDEKLVDIEEKISEVKAQYDVKYEAIKSTLDSKVARHEKFMNKNIKDNDQRAAKQHKKEIVVLQKNADKELKLLTSEFNDKFKVVESKKSVLVHEHLEQTSVYTKALIEFVEEKLFQIESYKITLNSNVDVLKFNDDSSIQDEINKFNEIERDILIKIAGIVLKQDIDLEQEMDNLTKIKLSFEKQNNLLKVKYEEELAIKAKELKIADLEKEFDDKLLNYKSTVEMLKFENEEIVAEKELVLNIKVNEENEIIEYHNHDFATQANLASEYLLFQGEAKNLIEKRADTLLSYEELEANNRADLKVAFLEAQKARIEKDLELLVDKINSTYEIEKVLYEEEKENASSKDKEELRIYEEEANASINKITEKRNKLDASAYKKEIKDLDFEITTLRDELNSYVNTKSENIAANTILFEKGIVEVNDRRDKSLEEVELYASKELEQILAAIELVNNNRLAEINDAKNRHLLTFEGTGSLLNNAQLRNNVVTEETTAFKLSRIQNENDVIKDFKDIFEKQKFTLKDSLDENLSELEIEIKSEENRSKEAISNEEVALEAKIEAFNNEISLIEENEVSKLEEQAQNHKINYSKAEQKEVKKIEKLNNDFVKKEATYRANIVELDRLSENESKNFENIKKVIQKDYELSLSKKLNEVAQQLFKEKKKI